MTKTLFVCDCQDVNHQLVVECDSESSDVYFYINLTTYRNFLQRCWAAIRYIFKLDQNCFDEVILNSGQQERLIAKLTEVQSNSNNI